MKLNFHAAFAITFLLSMSDIAAHATVIVRSIGGDATPASITPTRDNFRIDLGGGTTAGANGSFGGLRREINWDGVAATASAPNSLPANFFNSTSPRGVVFSTPGTGFGVSSAAADNGAGQPAAATFGNINANYTNTFGVFSSERVFTAFGSTITDVNFFLPGTNTVASVSGFGAVFTDVDTAGSTTIQLFDPNNVSLGTFNVAAGTVASRSLSFLGLFTNAGERIGRARITSGNAALGAATVDGGATDLVVMDDFIYSEPVAVPEPSSLLFGLAGVAAFAARRRLKRTSSAGAA